MGSSIILLWPMCKCGRATDFNKHSNISLQKSKWERESSTRWQCKRQAATTDKLRSLGNSAQYQFLPVIPAQYLARRQSIRSTPCIPSLYSCTRYGYCTLVLGVFITQREASWRQKWGSWLLAIVTIELSFHICTKTSPSQQKSNFPLFPFLQNCVLFHQLGSTISPISSNNASSLDVLISKELHQSIQCEEDVTV